MEIQISISELAEVIFESRICQAALAEVYMSVFVFQNAIANASSLAEVERLKGMLQAGQIPGRDLRSQGQSNTIPELD